MISVFCFVSKESLNIPEYRCLLIGRVQYLYTIEHAVGNIAYFNSLISGVAFKVSLLVTSAYFMGNPDFSTGHETIL